MTRPPTKKDLIAQWAFDTRPLLLRFHLWLEDVEVEWLGRGSDKGFDHHTFVPAGIRRCLAATAAVTALGTRLFARFGEGRGADKQTLNQIKKDADAISAYVMSEALWHFTRRLPENHAIMVCLGEGLMPKAGETPEMGANPLLGFGRVYARPEVAKFIDSRVHRLLNDPDYGWTGFYKKMREKGFTIWGAAVDTLENTSRFAKGDELGPMAVLHLFDQPLAITRPYKAYMGALTLLRDVVETAEAHSIQVDLLTPRRKLVEAIELTLPGIRREHSTSGRSGARAGRPGWAGCGRSGGSWACTWWRTAGPVPAGCRPSPSRAPTRPPTSSGPGRILQERLTSSCATAMRRPPRRSRRRAWRRRSTSTSPSPSSPRSSSCPWSASSAWRASTPGRETSRPSLPRSSAARA